MTTFDQALRVTEGLTPPDQLRLIGVLSERLRQRLDPDGEPVNMLSLVGLGAEIWREIDVATYLEQERADVPPSTLNGGTIKGGE